jgi:diketogulonate reductase-like aldo/keto reductase
MKSDTAAFYQNERDIGQAIRESKIPRKDVFVTSKLWIDSHGYQNALRAFGETLNQLQLDYVDLYLIHWPGSSTLSSYGSSIYHINMAQGLSLLPV